MLKSERIGSDHVSKSINENISTTPAIEPERHFFEVGGKMFCRDFMPRSHDAALEQAKCALDGIGVDVAIKVLLFPVADGLVVAENASIVLKG